MKAKYHIDPVTAAARVRGDYAKNILTRRNQKAKRRNANKERKRQRAWLTLNRDKAISATKRWKANNPARVLAMNAQRQSHVRMATPSWVDREQLQAVYDECKRLESETGIRHDVDHIIPLRGKNVCGLHVPWNLRAIPRTENQKKSNRLLRDLWRAWRRTSSILAERPTAGLSAAPIQPAA